MAEVSVPSYLIRMTEYSVSSYNGGLLSHPYDRSFKTISYRLLTIPSIWQKFQCHLIGAPYCLIRMAEVSVPSYLLRMAEYSVSSYRGGLLTHPYDRSFSAISYRRLTISSIWQKFQCHLIGAPYCLIRMAEVSVPSYLLRMAELSVPSYKGGLLSHPHDRSFSAISYRRLTSSSYDITHWDKNKMAAISRTTFSNAFSWMEMFEFRSLMFVP